MNIVCPSCFATNRVPEQRLADTPHCGKCRTLLFQHTTLAVNAEGLHRMITRNEMPVVVDFWAPWCGPCKIFAPVYEQAAKQLEPRVRLLKVNTEAEPQAAAPHAIRSIPTLAVFKGGREIARRSGALPLQHFIDWVTSRI